jgi:hypothetical protein
MRVASRLPFLYALALIAVWQAIADEAELVLDLDATTSPADAAIYPQPPANTSGVVEPSAEAPTEATAKEAESAPEGAPEGALFDESNSNVKGR